ncbi:hypothetical protein [Streptomyces echinatus]|uniref:hypothetical protein n=1 Tax=Streptomyces echinatus TaxID=67293 RepID=UPI0037F885DF
MGSEQSVCPVCGQPVETVVKRHKTLGAWVPVWAPGPCRNPGCAASAGAGRSAEAERSDGARAQPGDSGPERPSEAGAKDTTV